MNTYRIVTASKSLRVSKEIVTSRCDKQVVASSKEIVTVTYRVVVTSKSLQALKKSLRSLTESLWHRLV
ncbi:hypothetical protein Taro_032598 [Colocasia esculenta]|uniref:Uncharacterized protein n=1 Tax=Colocasia esculenta TaxID=4460 RepID=A0A843W9X4_COLES|nr:hypothetical protein [Colocasia esculenta]